MHHALPQLGSIHHQQVHHQDGHDHVHIPIGVGDHLVEGSQKGVLRGDGEHIVDLDHRAIRQDLIGRAAETFSEALIRMIDERGFKDPEVYKKANISKQHFSKIKNSKDYQPKKSTALAFAVALKLNLDETKDLIGKAGYLLTPSSKFDIIVEYFIVHNNYDIFELNEVLFAFTDQILGS